MEENMSAAKKGSLIDFLKSRISKKKMGTEEGNDSREVKKELMIPSDGNLCNFTPSEMESFLLLIGVNYNVVKRLKERQLDGNRFAKMKDENLESLGMNNPVIVYFRDKSVMNKPQFVL